MNRIAESYIHKYLDLDLVSPVPSGTLGDELSPSGTIAGSISRVTPVHTHSLQISKSSFSVNRA